jgi:thioredoxin-dependent peroxiredoxin
MGVSSLGDSYRYSSSQFINNNQTHMKTMENRKAIDFTARTIHGEEFTLSAYTGEKILLSFLRNGACALCNLRIHQLIENFQTISRHGIRIVAVFESSPEDMLPYVGKQQPPFVLLSDPAGKLYGMYGLETSQEKVNAAIHNNVVVERIKEAAAIGYSLTPQAGSNFFRLPGDFLIDEDFKICVSHYSNIVVDHIPLEEVIAFADNQVAAAFQKTK